MITKEQYEKYIAVKKQLEEMEEAMQPHAKEILDALFPRRCASATDFGEHTIHCALNYDDWEHVPASILWAEDWQKAVADLREAWRKEREKKEKDELKLQEDIERKELMRLQKKYGEVHP